MLLASVPIENYTFHQTQLPCMQHCMQVCGRGLAVCDMCFSIEASLAAAAVGYTTAMLLWIRGTPRAGWLAVSLAGWCSMQLAEAALWTTSPSSASDGDASSCSDLNRALSVSAIPLALSLQVWGPCLGGALVVSQEADRTAAAPFAGRRRLVLALLALGGTAPLLTYSMNAVRHGPWCTVLTEQRHLQWAYRGASVGKAQWLTTGLAWCMLITTPFLLYWRPLWQALVLTATGAAFMLFALAVTDSPASNWCLYVSAGSGVALAWLAYTRCRSVHQKPAALGGQAPVRVERPAGPPRQAKATLLRMGPLLLLTTALSAEDGSAPAPESASLLLQRVLAAHPPPVPFGYQHWSSVAQLRANWEAYRVARARCVWHRAARPVWHRADATAPDLAEAGLEQLASGGVAVPLPTRSCEVTAAPPASDSGSDGGGGVATWLIQRAGPIVSHGGEDFHTLAASDVFGLSQRAAASLAVDAMLVSPVLGPPDDPILAGYPPLRPHHAHLGPARSRSAARNGAVVDKAPLLFPHEDTYCSEADGGTACLLMTLPAGTAIALAEPLVLGGVWNDVRRADAPALQWWLELAVRHTTEEDASPPIVGEASPPPFSLRMLGLFYSSQAPDILPEARSPSISAGAQRFLTFAIPPDADSAVWSAVTPLASGTLRNLWLHTHPLQGFESMWLVGASPALLGLGQPPFEMPRCSRPFVPANHGLTLDDLKATVLAHLEQRRLRVRCMWGGAHAEYVPEHSMAGVVGGNYSRETPVTCYGADATRLTRGETLTALVFFTPAHRSPAARGVGAVSDDGGLMIQMHAHFQGFIEWDDGSSDLHFLAANQYGSQPMRVLSPCQAAALVASPGLCLWELPGCQQASVPVEASTTMLGALFLAVVATYLRGVAVLPLVLIGALKPLLLLCGAAAVVVCVRRTGVTTRHRLGGKKPHCRSTKAES